MQQNARVTAITVSELLRGNQPGVGWGMEGVERKITTPPTQIRVNQPLVHFTKTQDCNNFLIYSYIILIV